MARVHLSDRAILLRAQSLPATYAQTIADATAGNKDAMRYLRAKVLTWQEWAKENPVIIDEDGPCAGFGCETTLIG